MPIDLSHLRPCGQRWEDMTPGRKGRICAGCGREVIDFRRMTDLQIAREHAASRIAVCGLYSPAQLAGRAVPVVPVRARRAVAVALGTAAAGALPVLAQPPGPVPELAAGERPDIAPVRSAVPLPAPAIQDTVRIRGIVRDAANGTVLPGAQVMVRDTNYGVLTDLDGAFELRVPAGSRPIVLIAQVIGFGSREVELPADTREAGLDIDLEMMDLSISFYVTVVTAVPPGRSLLGRIADIAGRAGALIERIVRLPVRIP